MSQSPMLPAELVTSSPTPVIPRPTPASAPTPIAVLDDTDFIRGLITQLLRRSGLSQMEVSRRMGTASGNTVYQYLCGTVSRPSVQWLTRFCHACGARLLVEFPHE